ncbi:hypothetical protein LBMAG56_21140 [Verrucomicrobiota bacterium]|nr:hypothetical protein LBMAG56_21140 [Verrucomicrobiota bacterium]
MTSHRTPNPSLRDIHFIVRFLLRPIFVLLFAFPAVAADGPWLTNHLFRVRAVAAKKSPSYEVRLAHHGLAHPDGRDVRVVGPDGQPASLLLGAADTTQFRVVFDGAAGQGTYHVYFGNLGTNLPPVPAGVSAFGRKEWAPTGGYSCVSFDQIQPFNRNDLVSREIVLGKWDELRRAAEAAELADAQKQPDPARRRRYIVSNVFRSANVATGLGGQFFHIFRAEIAVAVAGKYELVIGDARTSQHLGVLFLDGNLARPVISGWFNKKGFAGHAYDTIGTVQLAAGPHVLEFFTTRPNPELKLGLAGSGKPATYLDGAQAHYRDARALAAGEVEVERGTVAEGFLAAARGWIQTGRYTLARTLCEVAQGRFAGDAELLKKFATESERAELAAFENNWLTEGKLPSRAGAVAKAEFGPPLRMAAAATEQYVHDQRHTSSAVWSEGRLVYGLPYELQAQPWSVTSGISLADDTLFAGTKDGVLHAVNATDGLERWTFPAGGECLGTPLLYRGLVYFGGLDRRLYALDARRGRMVWNFPARGWIEGSACGGEGRIYFGARDGFLYAVDARLGVERWATNLGAAIVATPVTDGTRVFVGTRAGSFCAVQAASGKVLWRYAAGPAVTGGACVSGGRVAFGDGGGSVHALDAATGKLAWKRPCAVGGAVVAAPILVGSVLYGGTDDGKVWGVDWAEGFLGWQENLSGGGEVRRPPLFADDTLVFISQQRNALNAAGVSQVYRGSTVSFKMADAPAQKCLQAVESITVDGKLDEPSWALAPRLPVFYQRNGLTNADPVEARVLWDDKHLHFAVSCRDAKVVSGDTAHDGNLARGNVIRVLLDPRRDGLAVFEFTLAPNGTRADTLRSDLSAEPDEAKRAEALVALKLEATGADWNPAWTAAATATGPGGAPGWTAEISIPFDSLPKSVAPKPGNGATWRFNVVVENRATVGAAPAGATYSLSPVLVEGGVGKPARWAALQFQAVKVKK